MTGSSTPLTDHPVHRANAMLRAALLNSTFSPERLAAIEESDCTDLFDDVMDPARALGARTYQCDGARGRLARARPKPASARAGTRT